MLNLNLNDLGLSECSISCVLQYVYRRHLCLHTASFNVHGTKTKIFDGGTICSSWNSPCASNFSFYPIQVVACLQTVMVTAVTDSKLKFLSTVKCNQIITQIVYCSKYINTQCAIRHKICLLHYFPSEQ